MTKSVKMFQRVLSLVLCLALLAAYLPASMLNAQATTRTGRNSVADESTMDGWKDYFLPDDGSISTEYAGGVWTDKSVFTNADAFLNTGIGMDETDDFLVALSAIGSNKTVSGMSMVPSDTILVLDVSGSMNGWEGNNDVAEELVESANTSIHALMTANDFNRVGVVLYSSSSTVMLPLNRYETGADNQYLVYSSDYYAETVSVSQNTVIEGTKDKPQMASRDVMGGTYIQSGIALAAEQFTDNANDTTLNDAVLGTIKRKPVLVLMSDGAPTFGSTNYMNPGSSNLGNGEANNAAYLGFVTQLTAAYARSAIEKKYDTKMLFYTLGLGTGSNTVATSVLNPENTSNAIKELWTRWDDEQAGDDVLIYSSRNGRTKLYVKKTDMELNRTYVDSYFDSADYTAAGSLGQALKDAFQDIVDDIQVQSAYFPTLISESEDLSGYISFVDRIASYMEVTDIKGLLINNTLYSGAELAKNFDRNSDGGDLGTVTNPTALGDELVWSIMARAGLETADEARTLIGLAYEYGQLSYTDENDFSNYIGWYANAAGEFLGFWHDGITTMPDPEDPTLTDDTRPQYIIKSYGYLGAVDETHGVAASDMMYATVQVREDILTGEQLVAFAVPAALIPLVSYNVSLDETGKLEDLTVGGAEHPIRLVYSVGLQDNIHSFNLKDVVSAEYLAENTNSDGSVNFYTNQWEADVSYNSVNAYSYFNPSRQNDRYYYLEDTLIYTDDQGTPLPLTEEPSGTLYRAHTIYKKNGDLETYVGYHPLTQDILGAAVKGSDGWYIPKGHVRADYENYGISKENANITNTLSWANLPFVDTENHDLDDLGYSYYVGATLGNNGKLTLAPETGIRLEKTMAEGETAPADAFTFTLKNTTNSQDNTSYPAWRILADGTEENLTVTFSAGEATVTLHAGDKLYIGGMTDGHEFVVSETETAEYMVESVNGDANLRTATVTVTQNNFAAASFVNTSRGAGNLTIAKDVSHPFGTSYQIPDTMEFTIHVTLSGIGVQNQTFTASKTGDTSVTEIRTGDNGEFAVMLKDNQQLEIFGLPAGTVATVVEQQPGEGFTAGYYVNGAAAAEGVVTVATDRTVSVIVLNSYEVGEVPTPINITVGGSKLLQERVGNDLTTITDWTSMEWMAGGSFTFELQRAKGDGTWETVKTDTVTAEDTDKLFSFGDALANETYKTIGTYNYRVVETRNNPIPGMEYDLTVHSFTVHVTDMDMNGALEVSDITSSRPDTVKITGNAETGWDISVAFTNTYDIGTSDPVAIEIRKLVENPSNSLLASAQGFQFALYDENGMPVATSLQTNTNGTTRLVLGPYDGDDVGTHKYTLKELPTNKPGWVKNEQSYPITVTVTKEGDHLVAAISVGENGTAANQVDVTFTNTYRPASAALTLDFIYKQLTGRDLKAGEFQFQIRDQVTGLVVKNLAGEDMIGTNAAANAGEKAAISFPTWTFDTVGEFFYDVVEMPSTLGGITIDKNVYRLKVTVSDLGNGNLQATYDLLNVAGSEILFQNTYIPASVSHAIGGQKYLLGKALLNDEFSFTMAVSDAQGNVSLGALTWDARNTMDGSFRFPAISYTGAGTYYYLVSEKPVTSGTSGIEFDETAYIVTVVIADNGQGNLVVDSVTYAVKGGAAADAISFTNRYVPNGTSANIPGNKVLEGRVWNDAKDIYEFTLYNSNASWEQGTVVNTVKNAADGTFRFPDMPYDKAGTYYYLVKEENGGSIDKGVTYDSSVFRVLVEVTDDLRGQLHANVFIFLVYDEAGNDLPQEEITFINKYAVTGTGSVTLTGEKILEGRDLKDGEFTFHLYQTGENFAVESDPKQSVGNTGKDFSFNLSYDAEDVGNTYYYVVREEGAGTTHKGVSFSNTEYHITVSVEDNGEGGIRTNMTISDGTNTATTLRFVNTYSAAATSVEFTGEKTLEGIRDLKEKDFYFQLFLADADFAAQGAALQTVPNAADGTIRFDAVELSEAKIHYFLIREVSDDPIGGVTYDPSVYQIAVTVKDDGNGQLYVDGTKISRVRDNAAENADSILFENSYRADSAVVTLSGMKKLAGRELTAGEFAFLLSEANEQFVVAPDAQTEKAFNEADGKFAFQALTFAEIGTYYYVVTEDATVDADRVTFDEAVYQVTITVSDDANGKLVAQLDIVKAGETEWDEGIAFSNVYTPKPDDIQVSITVDKTVTNLGKETMGPGGFAFRLENTESKLAQEKTTDAQGVAAFALTFTEEDIGKTYTYRLTEVDGKKEHIQYSTAKYDISITISLDDSNKLVASITSNGKAVEQVVAEFENIYNYTHEEPPKTGDMTAPALLAVLLLASGTGLVLVVSKKKEEAQA